MTPTNNTVYGRMKNNGGYLTSSRHSMGPAMADMSPAAPAAKADGPPGLRDADVPESCGDCANFSDGQCDKFNTSVTPNQVCDDFTEGAPDNGEEDTGTEIPQGPGEAR